MIEGVQDVYVNVADMGRALAFYGGLLEAEPVEASEHWSAFRVGDLRLGLHWTGGDPVPPVAFDAHGAHQGATLTLRSDDVAGDAARVEELGGTLVGGPSDNPWGTLAVCRDPDGNVVKLMSPAA